jgi:superfamily II DNA/RNA helicase
VPWRSCNQRYPILQIRPIVTTAKSPQALSLSSLDSLVIDEADLILSYGHDEDVRHIFNGQFLPNVFQSFLMSATMTEDVELLKGMALRNPVCRPVVHHTTFWF